jgi:hypothetical protein
MMPLAMIEELEKIAERSDSPKYRALDKTIKRSKGRRVPKTPVLPKQKEEQLPPERVHTDQNETGAQAAELEGQFHDTPSEHFKAAGKKKMDAAKGALALLTGGYGAKKLVELEKHPRRPVTMQPIKTAGIRLGNPVYRIRKHKTLKSLRKLLRGRRK